MPAGDASFTLTYGGLPVSHLDTVSFGDVFLFSGQSNIDISASYAHQFNATAERAEEEFADWVRFWAGTCTEGGERELPREHR